MRLVGSALFCIAFLAWNLDAFRISEILHQWVSIILALRSSANRTCLVVVLFSCLPVCGMYFKYYASIKSHSGIVLAYPLTVWTWMWNRLAILNFFCWIHPVSLSIGSYTSLILVWPLIFSRDFDSIACVTHISQTQNSNLWPVSERFGYIHI